MSASVPAGPVSMSPGVVVVLLSLLLGLQPLTTDLYLPALPGLTRALGAEPAQAQAQATLAVLLLAFGISQLAWGPLSDRFGRRPVLLAGIGIYVGASVGCALAPSMDLLVAWRAAQGAAMGAAVMGARAIVRDLYEPQVGARTMAKGLSGLGVIACLSAPLGGVVADLFGWRWALALLGIFSALLWLIIARHFTESLPAERRAPLHPGAIARSWWTIIRHPTFLAGSALATTSYAGLFTFLATAPFVFGQVIGLGATEVGVALFSVSLTYLAGTVLARRLLTRIGLRRAVMWAGGVSLLAGTVLVLLAWAGVRGIWALLPPIWLFMLAHGVHQPCGQVVAVAPFPKAAGAAAALNGFLMMLVAFAMGGWLGRQAMDSAWPLVSGLWFWGVCIAVVAFTLVRRHGELRRA
ncbi:Bcr/CflA family efflux MFS transporter [Ramlibacter sp. AW1]|uniref:Bcr/CflA family efflux transporter n=1 Tax=Ramlibacter aurantiacus TaxID=2801330 RepID=A0A936ZML1_9BURK|nr:Bcr/CflA family efflux MFS transporter [Ramlibacter aurantiacus]MBL0420451.1 Bcr/CflA family efflux MFS transporter [Ramlibacter aurantiacus]